MPLPDGLPSRDDETFAASGYCGVTGPAFSATIESIGVTNVAGGCSALLGEMRALPDTADKVGNCQGSARCQGRLDVWSLTSARNSEGIVRCSVRAHCGAGRHGQRRRRFGHCIRFVIGTGLAAAASSHSPSTLANQPAEVRPFGTFGMVVTTRSG